MIGSVRGQIIAHASDKVLVEVGGAAGGTTLGAAGGTTWGTTGGIGYWVHVTPQTLAYLMSAASDSSHGFSDGIAGGLSSKNGSSPGSGSSKSKGSLGDGLGDDRGDNQGDNRGGNTAGGTGYGTAGSTQTATPTVLFYTEHVVREDANLLYGFLTAEEQMCFATLIGISGIGPQLALAVLATHSPSDLQTLLLEGDIDSLCLVPGIGPKKARQLMATMKDRFAIADFQPADAAVASSPRAEARQALSELGYSPEEVQAALANVSSPEGDISSADTETLVKAALSVLAK